MKGKEKFEELVRITHPKVSKLNELKMFWENYWNGNLEVVRRGRIVLKSFALYVDLAVVDPASPVTGATVGISGYSSTAPGSQVKYGQHPGKGAVLLVFSVT